MVVSGDEARTASADQIGFMFGHGGWKPPPRGVQTSRLLPVVAHPEVEDFDCGRLIDHGFLFACIASRFAQLGGGAGGGEGLINKNHRHGADALVKLRGKGPHFCRSIALAAVHAQRQADHERADSANLHKLRDALDGIELLAIDRLNRMRKNAEIIRRSDTDAGVSMVNPERGMR